MGSKTDSAVFFFFKSRYVCVAGTGCWHGDRAGLTLLKVYLTRSQRVKSYPHSLPLWDEEATLTEGEKSQGSS